MKVTAGDNKAIVSDEWQAFAAFISAWRKPLAIGAGAVVAVALIVFTSLAMKDRAVEKASAALSQARSTADLEQLLKDHQGTPAAPLAMLTLAKAYYDSGNFDRALSTYVEFQINYPDHPLTAIASLGQTHCVESSGQIREALESYSAFAATNSGHFLVPVSLMGKARCLEQAGLVREAREVYEDIIVTYTNSNWQSLADESLQRLKNEAAKTLSANVSVR